MHPRKKVVDGGGCEKTKKKLTKQQRKIVDCKLCVAKSLTWQGYISHVKKLHPLKEYSDISNYKVVDYRNETGKLIKKGANPFNMSKKKKAPSTKPPSIEPPPTEPQETDEKKEQLSEASPHPSDVEVLEDMPSYSPQGASNGNNVEFVELNNNLSINASQSFNELNNNYVNINNNELMNDMQNNNNNNNNNNHVFNPKKVKHNNNNDIKHMMEFMEDRFDRLDNKMDSVRSDIKCIKNFIAAELKSFREKLSESIAKEKKKFADIQNQIRTKKRRINDCLNDESNNLIDWYSFKDIPSMVEGIEWVELVTFEKHPDHLSIRDAACFLLHPSLIIGRLNHELGIQILKTDIFDKKTLTFIRKKLKNHHYNSNMHKKKYDTFKRLLSRKESVGMKCARVAYFVVQHNLAEVNKFAFLFICTLFFSIFVSFSKHKQNN